jgi:hypothetical protein
MSLSRSLPGSSRSSANALVMPRYASRSRTSRHHRAVTDDDGREDVGDRPKIASFRAEVTFHLGGHIIRQAQRSTVGGVADASARRIRADPICAV